MLTMGTSMLPPSNNGLGHCHAIEHQDNKTNQLDNRKDTGEVMGSHMVASFKKQLNQLEKPDSSSPMINRPAFWILDGC